MAFRYSIENVLNRSRSAAQLGVSGLFNPIYIPNYVPDSNGCIDLTHVPHHGPQRPFIYNVLHPILTTKRLLRVLKTPSTTKVIEPVITKENPDSIDFLLFMAGVGEGDAKVSVDGNTIFVEAEGDNQFLAMHGFKKYNCWIDLPGAYNKFRVSDIKADWMINGGAMALTVPKLKKSFDVKINRVIDFS